MDKKPAIFLIFVLIIVISLQWYNKNKQKELLMNVHKLGWYQGFNEGFKQDSPLSPDWENLYKLDSLDLSKMIKK